jgi:Zn-dependent peptidase ImmA (M78 family)
MMKSDELARKIRARFQTRDVYAIADKSRIRIINQKWHPVTLGEFDWRAKTIYVNENAAIKSEKIIAHELGHYFLKFFEVKNVADEERFCDEFAGCLLTDE